MADKVDITKIKQSSPKKWVGAFTAYNITLERLFQNNKPALLILGATLVLSILGNEVQPEDTSTNQQYFVYTDLLYFVFLLAIPTYALAVADNKTITIKQALRFDFMKYFSMFAVVILATLAIFGSLLLLIIPIIWTLAWFYLCAYPVVDKGLGPVDAMKESKRLAVAHKGKVWGLIGVSILLSIGVSILGNFPIIGEVAAMGATLWISATAAMLYRWLQKQPQAN